MPNSNKAPVKGKPKTPDNHYAGFLVFSSHQAIGEIDLSVKAIPGTKKMHEGQLLDFFGIAFEGYRESACLLLSGWKN